MSGTDYAEFEQVMSSLSDKHQRYVWGYLKTGSPTGAGRPLGYCDSRCSTLQREADIARAITLGQRLRWDRLQADADRVLKELLEMLEADIAEVYDFEGNIKPVDEWSKGLRKRVVAMDLATGKARFTDPLKLIELIGKHIDINAFRDTVQVETATEFTRRLEAARQRQLNQLPPSMVAETAQPVGQKVTNGSAETSSDEA